MLGIITVLLLGITEKLSILSLTKTNNFQEIKIILNYFVASIFFVALSLFSYDNFDFSFLKSWDFYAAIVLENVAFYYMIKNYNKQKSFAQIAFAAFSSIYLIIGVGYLYPFLFGLDMKIASPYHSLGEVLFFTFTFFTLTVAYFFDKIKNNDISHPLDLLKYAFFLVNVLYFAILMFQTYQAYLVYIFIFSSLIFQQIFHLNRKNELRSSFSNFKKLSKNNKISEVKSTITYSFLYILTFILSVISGNLISVEFFAIFKRTGQIAASYFIDSKILNKSIKISTKDILILGLIMLIALYLYYR